MICCSKKRALTIVLLGSLMPAYVNSISLSWVPTPYALFTAASAVIRKVAQSPLATQCASILTAHSGKCVLVAIAAAVYAGYHYGVSHFSPIKIAQQKALLTEVNVLRDGIAAVKEENKRLGDTVAEQGDALGFWRDRADQCRVDANIGIALHELKTAKKRSVDVTRSAEQRKNSAECAAFLQSLSDKRDEYMHKLPNVVVLPPVGSAQ